MRKITCVRARLSTRNGVRRRLRIRLSGKLLTDTDVSVPAFVALAADMIFAARIRGAANAAGVPVRVLTSADSVADSIRGGASRLMLDLDFRSADPVTLIERLRADPDTAAVEIIAFVSHVRGDRIAAARAAGATRVMARSAFMRELPGLLAAIR